MSLVDQVSAKRPYRVTVDEDGTAFPRRDRCFAFWLQAKEYAEGVLGASIGSTVKVRVLVRSLKTEGYSNYATWDGLRWDFAKEERTSHGTFGGTESTED